MVWRTGPASNELADPLGQAEQPGGDRGQLVAEGLVDALGGGQAQAVGGHDQGVAGPGGAADEVDQQPVELPPVDGAGSGHDHPPAPGGRSGPASSARPAGAPLSSTTALAAWRLAW